MKTKRNIYSSICVLICILIIVGCKPKSQVVTSETHQKETLHNSEKSNKLNLLDLPADRKVIPLEHPKNGIISGSALIIEAEPVKSDTIFQLIENIPNEIDSLNSLAYRVQIFSSKKFGESRQAKLVAEEIFDRPVFLDYEVPYYKIRVGNFSNRDKAEEYQQRVKSSGYKNAWVVVVIVDVKETSPLYDELLIPQTIDSLTNQEESDNNVEPEDE